MATHSSSLAWKIRWTEELGGPQSMAGKESDMTEQRTLSWRRNCRTGTHSCYKDPHDSGGRGSSRRL